MRSNGRQHIIKWRYNTDDITRTVIHCYNLYRGQTRDVAASLRGATEEESCRRVWQHVVDHIRYREDGAAYQHVKTPARLFDDGEGDCKSIAVFCASCLANMGIPCRFRFVNFDPADGREVKHVYVVTEGGVALDPVEYMQNGRPFGEVTPYHYKKDMKVNKHGLAILSGVGSADPYRVFMNGTSFTDNTQAENYLYSALDLQFTLLELRPDDTEAMNACDRLVCALTLYREAEGDAAMLRRAGHVLQLMADQGYFASTATDDGTRADRLDTLASVALDYLASDAVMAAEGPVEAWFADQVAAADGKRAGGDFREQYARWQSQQRGDASLGASSQNELLDRMKETAPYFTYLFLSSDFYDRYYKQYPQIYTKMMYEKNVYEAWVKGFREELSEATIRNVLYSGACARLGATPEEWVLANLKGKAKVGFLATLSAIIGIVVSVVGLIGSIVGLCKSLSANKEAKTQQLLDKAAGDTPEGQMEEGDFAPGLFGNNTDGGTTSSGGTANASGGILFLLLGGGLLLSMLGKKKK